MSKFLAFFHSPVVTHIIGVAGTLTAGVVIPNSPAASIAIAAITGITQASHAYATVRTQPGVGQADVTKAVG